MELFKTNESVSREFVDGEVIEKLNTVSFQIKEGENVIGTAQVNAGGFSISVNRMDASPEELKAELESLFTTKTASK